VNASCRLPVRAGGTPPAPLFLEQHVEKGAAHALWTDGSMDPPAELAILFGEDGRDFAAVIIRWFYSYISSCNIPSVRISLLLSRELLKQNLK
jgi:hypothetical protein